METLLCRRFDLARSAGRALEDADPVVVRHLEECGRCQEVYEAELSIADALVRHQSPLPPVARKRIEALVAVHARAGRGSGPSLGPTGNSWAIALAALAAAAVLVLAVMPPAAAETTPEPEAQAAGLTPTPTVAPQPQRAEGEAISGLQRLIERHRTPQRLTGDVPNPAVVYEAKLPHALANQLVAQPESSTASWDGFGLVTHVDDATLFVLDRARAVVDPVLEEVLTDAGSITLQRGPHQIAIARRDNRLFVIIANPAGLESVAGDL